jgi:probable HAF family extracellular repeat protein
MRSVSCVRFVLTLVAIVLGTHSAATPADAQPMVGLGSLSGGVSEATGVSADGSTVVGWSYYDLLGNGEAFRWTAATGMVGLGTLPNPGTPYIGSFATGVSADGSTVVGSGYAISPDFSNSSVEAFIWTPATGLVGLGGLPGAPPQYGTSSPYSVANGVSGDGSTVVGEALNAQNRVEAFIWTAATGMVGLGTLPGATSSSATGLSSDGSTVVGSSGNQAFIWTAATGMVGLGTLSGFTSSSATGVSGDGSTVVGSSGNQAFIWTAATGMVGLGTLSGFTSSSATGVSGDGSTVVGYNLNAQGYQEAFVWTATTGMVGLGYLPGTVSSVADGASRDGSRVVGYSFNNSYQEAFVWTPATGLVALGYLPGATSSSATGVSSDGSTVVGVSGDEAFVLQLQLSPAQLILALIEQVKGLNLKYGIQNSLDSKLDAALQALGDVNNHNNAAAVNALNAFINAVNAQRGKAIPAAAADALIAAATVIIHLLQ